MTAPDRPLTTAVEEVMRTLLASAPAESRVELERQALVFQELDLDSEDFSPQAFLESEVRRALGL